ncbi:iron uptake protein [Roseateles albus]|uniref:Iron uptake protein n=1 Tax=Roseateles albus TaxID=2987525 RepID=A0ABT5KJ95_9BURK|nr:iron uptake protein [Roseateles albus]MDC8773462.1 iron uptake protein [Roseateles albus]
MRTTPLSRTHLFGRIAAAALGGYAFCWGFIALGLALLYGAGLGFHDAEHIASMLGLLLFLGVFCWAFAARSLEQVWVILAGGGVLMSGGAALVQRSLVAAAGGL